MTHVRTTLDLPDPLFRELKARAAMQGMKMKELITRLIESGLRQQPIDAPDRPRPRSRPPIIEAAAVGESIPAVSREDLDRMEMEEDLEKLDRSSGR
jgi:hypothetical protein